MSKYGGTNSHLGTPGQIGVQTLLDQYMVTMNPRGSCSPCEGAWGGGGGGLLSVFTTLGETFPKHNTLLLTVTFNTLLINFWLDERLRNAFMLERHESVCSTLLEASSDKLQRVSLSYSQPSDATTSSFRSAPPSLLHSFTAVFQESGYDTPPPHPSYARIARCTWSVLGISF